MKRKHIIDSLVNQFAENIKNLSDETLQDVESGKLVISLTPAVGKEAGGAGVARATALKSAELTKTAQAKQVQVSDRLMKI
ncbi:hypothetical protein [Legionella sainthelensi]|uniref:hypothetical protein n=1 Tax=Legionella sainthelensi TaxID=28087 RepID=UPI000E2049EE|nr:hypothetical protein [Legionella sainthelensi]